MSTIKSVSGVNDDGSKWTLSVGDRVAIEADECDEDSSDTGRIVEFRDTAVAVVAWDSECTTTTDVARLTSI